MLRKIRIAAAAVFFTMITLLFLDYTGTLHAWFGWMARVQLLPAVLAVNVAVVAALLVLTLLFGRVYCSVICPLGVFQDVASWAGGRRRKNRFTYSRALPWLRYGMLALFVAAMVAHIKPVAELLAPYSAYGRIASNLFAPLYRWGNNLLAYAAERIDSYAFYTVDVWVKSGVTFAVAAATFAVLAVLAWRNGRTYCNTVCPVGTLLGFVSRFAVFKPRIDTSKCNGCGLCAQLQGLVHRRQVARNRLQPLCGLHGLYRQMPSARHRLFAQTGRKTRFGDLRVRSGGGSGKDGPRRCSGIFVKGGACRRRGQARRPFAPQIPHDCRRFGLHGYREGAGEEGGRRTGADRG